MAPELLRGEPYDDGVDWWALGCVFHELLSGKPPFSRDRPRDMFCAILREEPPSLIVKCGVECNDAVQGLLKKSSSERFGSDSLRSHAFFGDVDWSAMERKEVAPPHTPILPDGNEAVSVVGLLLWRVPHGVPEGPRGQQRRSALLRGGTGLGAGLPPRAGRRPPRSETGERARR